MRGTFLLVWALVMTVAASQQTARIFATPQNITTLVIAGVHARERITTHVASMLSSRAYLREKSLTTSRPGKLIIVPEVVKGSESCWRGNFNNVDINRNFPVNWRLTSPDSKFLDYGGSKPLSEPESRYIYGLLETHRPDLFIDLHSGEVAVYTPWHAKLQQASTALSAQDLVLRIPELRGVKAGAGGLVGGYMAYGTIADTALEHFGARCVFTFEIYGEPQTDCKRMFNPPHSEWHALSEHWASIVEQTMTECERALYN